MFVEDASNKFAWIKHIILHFLNFMTVAYMMLKDEVDTLDNLAFKLITTIVIFLFALSFLFYIAYYMVIIKLILTDNYNQINEYSSEINKTFNSIEAAMIQFDNGGVKFINNNIINLLHNTLPDDIEIKLLNIGLQSGYQDLQNLE